MLISAFDPPRGGLRQRAISGVMKTGLSQGVRLLVTFGSTVILSRLLIPAEFGLLAMAGPIVGFAALFQDLGLTQAVVQKPTLTQQEVSALFFISVGVCGALALILLGLAPFAALFYGEPRVGALTAALGFNVAIGGTASLPYALLNRQMRFGAVAGIEAAAAVGSLVVAVAMALVLHNAWALYAGSLAGTVIPAAGCWLAAGWRPSLPRRGSGAGAALHFGANVTGFNIANFLSRNLDNVLIGRAWGERPLGLYDRAYKLLLFPLQQINGPIAKVMLPVLSQMVGEPVRYRRAFLRTLSQILLISLPGIAFMVGTSDVLIPVVLGRQWAEASSIFSMLGLAGFLQMLNSPSGWLFVSQNRTREYMVWGFVSAGLSVISFIAGLPYGPIGVASAYAVCELVRTPLLWWGVARRGPVTLGWMVRTAAPHYAGALASLGAVALVRQAGPMPVFDMLGLSLAASFAASLLVLAMFPSGRETVTQALQLTGRLAGRLRT